MTAKISELSLPTLPLSGTELIEMSQSSTSVKVTFDEMQSGVLGGIGSFDGTTFTVVGTIVADDLLLSGATLYVGDGQVKSSIANSIELYAGSGNKVLDAYPIYTKLLGTGGVTSGCDLTIFSGDGEINAYVEGRINSQSVFNFDANTQRLGIWGDTYVQVTANENSTEFYCGGTKTLDLSATVQQLGFTNNVLLVNNSGNTITMDVQGLELFDITALTHARLGSTGAGAVNITMNHSGATIESYVDGDLMINMSKTSQSFGLNTDVHIQLTQSTDTIDIRGGATSIASFDLQDGVNIGVIKSGATQGGASAAAGELWKTASHATLPDNVVMIGV